MQKTIIKSSAQSNRVFKRAFKSKTGIYGKYVAVNQLLSQIFILFPSSPSTLPAT